MSEVSLSWRRGPSHSPLLRIYFLTFFFFFWNVVLVQKLRQKRGRVVQSPKLMDDIAQQVEDLTWEVF